MLNLSHPNIVRAYHCITKQLMTAAQQPGSAALPAQQQPASMPAASSNPGSLEEEGRASSCPGQRQLGSAGQPPMFTVAPPANGVMPVVSSPLPASNLSSSQHVQDLMPASPAAALRSWRQGSGSGSGSAGIAAGVSAPGDANAACSSSHGLVGSSSAAAAGSQPSTISSTASRASGGGGSIQGWQLLPATGSAQCGPQELDSDLPGFSGGDGSGAHGSPESSRSTRLVADTSGVLCETWLVTELCDR